MAKYDCCQIQEKYSNLLGKKNVPLENGTLKKRRTGAYLIYIIVEKRICGLYFGLILLIGAQCIA